MAAQDFPPGRLATDRNDFKKHVNGNDFRHNSNNIDINPSVDINGTVCYDASSAFDAISNFISSSLNSTNGQGFVAIGDGLDTYHNAILTPDTPFDPLIPSINAALNNLFTNTSNPNYARIRDGGIILIKSGTYIIDDTIEIPAGITIIGEGFGTKLINYTSTQKPLFKIKKDSSRTVDNGVDSISKFMYAKETKFYNLTIADNFVIPKNLGDLSYLNVKNKDSIHPLISVEEGAFFTADNVKFIGKTKYVTTNLTEVTSYAIKTDSTIPVTSGTIINIKNCFIDGFSLALESTNLGGTNDYLNFVNNKVRFYGFLNSDIEFPENNCCIKTNVCNINAQGNYIFGFDDTASNFIYLNDVVTGSVVEQSKSKLIVSNNTIAIDKSNGSVLTFNSIKYSATVLSNSSKYTIINDSNLIDFNLGLNLVFNENKETPKITQQDKASGTAEVLTIQAQSSLSGTGGNLELISGNGTTDSGDIYVKTIDHTSGTINSGNIFIKTGNSYDGNSGNITIRTGEAANNGSTGDLYIATNSSVSGNAGCLFITSGSSTTGLKGYIRLDSEKYIHLLSSLLLKTCNVSSDYVILDNDCSLFIDTSLSSINVILPQPINGKYLIIKDVKGFASTNSIILNRFGSEKIDGVASNRILSTDFGYWSLMSDGNDWYFV